MSTSRKRSYSPEVEVEKDEPATKRSDYSTCADAYDNLRLAWDILKDHEALWRSARSDCKQHRLLCNAELTLSQLYSTKDMDVESIGWSLNICLSLRDQDPNSFLSLLKYRKNKIPVKKAQHDQSQFTYHFSHFLSWANSLLQEEGEKRQKNKIF